MKLTFEDVTSLATLARLDLSEEERKKLLQDLGSVLQYVERLQEVDTSAVEPYRLTPLAEGWRPDVASPCDDVARELVLGNFPARRGDLLKTPGVFESPKGGKS